MVLVVRPAPSPSSSSSTTTTTTTSSSPPCDAYFWPPAGRPAAHLLAALRGAAVATAAATLVVADATQQAGRVDLGGPRAHGVLARALVVAGGPGAAAFARALRVSSPSALAALDAPRIFELRVRDPAATAAATDTTTAAIAALAVHTGGGWSLVLPRACVAPLWHALVLRSDGAVAVGQRHLRALSKKDNSKARKQ